MRKPLTVVLAGILITMLVGLPAPERAQAQPKTIRIGLLFDQTREMARRYQKEAGGGEIPLYVSIGFNNPWILLADVLPRAIQKCGGFDPERRGRAAREPEIPDGGTVQGYGVKFYPPGHEMAGQQARAFPAVYQVIGGRYEVVYPASVATAAPVLPLPASSLFAAR
jgi:branched-chain amino acid transport system substrate-binding protein